jgi:enterochelin esterase-like enzyme
MRKIPSLLFILSVSSALIAQTGKVFDNLSLPSKILKMDRKYAIYLPPDYETSQRSYPALYLLHGYGDDQTGWVQFGEVMHITDEAINTGKATAMIIVMPDANAVRRGYVNDVKGEWQYEDFFFKELIPYIEKTYRIKPEKRYRAIAGLSMGGEGTFIYALHHPEMFSSACPLSAATGPRDTSMAEIKKYMLWQGLDQATGAAREAYYKQYSTLSLIENMPDNQKNAVRWYIDCGEDDFLIEGNSLVHLAIHKKGITHEYRMREGVHSWTYWRQSLPDVLEFVSMAFHQF